MKTLKHIFAVSPFLAFVLIFPLSAFGADYASLESTETTNYYPFPVYSYQNFIADDEGTELIDIFGKYIKRVELIGVTNGTLVCSDTPLYWRIEAPNSPINFPGIGMKCTGTWYLYGDTGSANFIFTELTYDQYSYSTGTLSIAPQDNISWDELRTYMSYMLQGLVVALSAYALYRLFK